MPLNFDMPSVYIVGSTLNVVLGICMVLVYLTRQTYPGFLQWTISTFVLGVLLTMLAYPQVFHGPTFFTFANLLFFLFPVLYGLGLRAFAGRPAANRSLLLLLLGYGLLVTLLFTVVQPNMVLRVSLLTLAIAGLYLGCAWFVWRQPAFRYPIVRMWVAGTFALIAAWSMLRVILMVWREQGGLPSWPPSLIPALNITVLTGANIAMTIGFVVLNFQRTAANLLERERRFALAVSATQDAIWEWNLRTNEAYYSPRWFEMLGYPDQSLTMDEQTWELLCHPDDLAPALAKVKDSVESPASPTYVAEFRMRHRDGSWRWIQGRGRVVERDARGQAVMLSGTNTDVTEARHAREQQARLLAQLHQAQKMESLGTLAGGIAHDFNNILVGILGNLQLAEMELDENHPTRPLLGHAHKASLRARDLIARIMTFSRKSDPSHQSVALEVIIREVAALVRASLPSNITLLLQLAPACPPFLGDGAQVHEALMNLIVNSSTALGTRGGIIEISLRHGPAPREVLEQHPHIGAGDHLQLAVRDTGTGMTPEVRGRIFEPFFSTKGPGQGSGIGLTMVHRIVTDAGGTIAVDSALGLGTTITLFLPVAPVAPPQPPAPGPTGVLPRAHGRVLIVDDEPSVLAVTKRVLQQIGLTPEAHSHPSTALAAFQANPTAYVIVLTDLSMPGMSGLDLAAEIRRSSPRVPIVIMTGNLTEAARAAAAELGPVQFLHKPFEVSALQALMAAAVKPADPA